MHVKVTCVCAHVLCVCVCVLCYHDSFSGSISGAELSGLSNEPISVSRTPASLARNANVGKHWETVTHNVEQGSGGFLLQWFQHLTFNPTVPTTNSRQFLLVGFVPDTSQRPKIAEAFNG